MVPDKIATCDSLRYGRADTTDGGEPFCGDFVAWRHPSFGNYTPAELSYEFVAAHDHHYSRRVFDSFECLVWLLSQDATWMPDRLREVLVQGFRDRVHWWITELWRGPRDAIVDMLLGRPRSRFAYTKSLKEALHGQIARALHHLQIGDDPNRIVARFIENEFLEAYYEEQDRIKSSRQKR
jgi:hypothetical protein